MQKYKEKAVELIKNIKYIIPVVITAILSFGFVITHHSINGDVLSYDRYFEQGELIAQGRFTAPLINKIFNIMNFNPFFVDTLAVLFLIASAILFCLLFDRVSKGKLNDNVYTIFSCLFISYPLISEIFTFTPASLSIGIGYFLTAISLMIGYESIFNCYSKIKGIIFETILLCLAVYLYESFAAVYLCGIFMILIIEYLYNKNRMKFFDLIKKGFLFVIPLVIAIIGGYIFVRILMKLLHLEKSNYSAKTIIYTGNTLSHVWGWFVKTTIERYILPVTYYLPITVLVLATVLYIIFLIKSSIKEKSLILLLLFIWLGIAVSSLSIIQGIAAMYRTCQTFAIFIAFVFMLVAHEMYKENTNKWVKNIFIIIVYTIIFYQVKDLNGWFVTNYQRYEIEKNAIINIGDEISENYDINKPVYFVGSYSLPDVITGRMYLNRESNAFNISSKLNKLLGNKSEKFKKDSNIGIYYGESNIISYIDWSISAFEKDDKVSVDLIKFFNYMGYDFKAGNRDIYEEYIVPLCEGKPEWPKKGSIFETDKYIIVNFG